MGIRIWGSLVSENDVFYEILLDWAADGEGNEYEIVQLPKNHIVETFLLHPIIRMGEAYGTHSDHTKYAQQLQQEKWLKKQEAKQKKNLCTKNQPSSTEICSILDEPLEPLRATHQIWGYIDAEVSLFIANAWGLNSENFKKPRNIRQDQGEYYQNRYTTKPKNNLSTKIVSTASRNIPSNYGRRKHKKKMSRSKVPRPKYHPTLRSTIL